MLKFIICEDNLEELNKTTVIVNKVINSCNYDSKVYTFNKYNKDLQELIDNDRGQKVYILDVELPVVSGLEIASKIRMTDSDSVIIFLTAHAECKNDIFYSRLIAIDYIIKQKNYEQRLEETLHETMKVINKRKVLIYRFDHNTIRIPYRDILYIERVPLRPKCTITTEEGDVFEIKESLINLEKRMSPMFCRSHQSCLVNVTKVKQIITSENAIVFKNGKRITLLSNRLKKGFKEHVKNYN